MYMYLLYRYPRVLSGSQPQPDLDEVKANVHSTLRRKRSSQIAGEGTHPKIGGN